jgi:hypothetical protein
MKELLSSSEWKSDFDDFAVNDDDGSSIFFAEDMFSAEPVASRGFIWVSSSTIFSWC